MAIYHSFSSAETKRLAERLAKRIRAKSRSNGKNAMVFALSGELGGGKTTFVQGFLKGLGIKRRALSPTFILVRRFTIRAKRFAKLYHIDVYRLKRPAGLAKLGFAEIVRDPRSVVLVEWAEKIKRLLPEDAVWIKFKHGKNVNERILKIL